MQPDLTASVVVPSLGPPERLRRLLDSLAVQTVEHEVIVVDNGSPGGGVTALCAEYGIEAVRLERNAGYSAAVNIGARAAGTDALVLINDDCVCDPDFIERIVAQLDPGAGVVMVSSVMRELRAPELIDSAGMELDPTLLVYDYMNGEPLTALDAAPPDPIGPSAAAAAFDRRRSSRSAASTSGSSPTGRTSTWSSACARRAAVARSQGTRVAPTSTRRRSAPARAGRTT